MFDKSDKPKKTTAETEKAAREARNARWQKHAKTFEFDKNSLKKDKQNKEQEYHDLNSETLDSLIEDKGTLVTPKRKRGRPKKHD